MATWSDKQLAQHKRAQGYLSTAGATLGVAALGAAGLKSKGAQKLGTKLVRVAHNRGASLRTTGKAKRIAGKAAGSAGGLTTASAGVGGVGGFNFAAIQSQESRKARVKKMDTNPFAEEVSKLSDRAKDNLIGAKVKRGERIAATKTNAKHTLAGAYGGAAAGALGGAALLGGAVAASRGKTHLSAFRAASKGAKARQITTGGKGRGAGLPGGGRYALRATKDALGSRNTRRAAGAGALAGGYTGGLAGHAVGVDRANRENRAAGRYEPRKVKKSVEVSKVVRVSAFGRAAQGVKPPKTPGKPLTRFGTRGTNPIPTFQRPPSTKFTMRPSGPATRGSQSRLANRGRNQIGGGAASGGGLTLRPASGNRTMTATAGTAAGRDNRRRNMALAGGAAGLAAGAAGGATYNSRKKKQAVGKNFEAFAKAKDWRNIEEHKAEIKRANRTKRKANATIAAGIGGIAAGTALSKPGDFSSAASAVRATSRGNRAVGNGLKQSAKNHARVGGAILRRKPGVALAGAGVAAVGTGAGVQSYANHKRNTHERAISRQRKQRAGVTKSFEAFAKAYDPERSRQKRLEGYSAGAYIAGGAAGAAGATRLKRAGSNLRTGLKSGAVTTKQLKAIGAHGGKGAALVAGGVGAVVGGKKIADHKKTRGRSYKALPLS